MSDLTENTPPEEPEDPQRIYIPPEFRDEEDLPEEGQPKVEVDPLAELRKNLLAEEQPPDTQSRPDLLQRMTGTIVSKKVPTRPRSQPLSDTGGFGVLTSRPSSYDGESHARPAVNSDDLHDDFLERRLNADPAGPRWNRPVLDKTKDSSSGADQSSSDASESKVRKVEASEPGSEVKDKPTSSRRLDPLWDGAEPEETQGEQGRPRKSGDFSRPVDEHKLLGSGAERRFEVNRYLSYNPKQSLWGKFRGLSLLEQSLVVVLIVAVIIVASLIASLYNESRNTVVVQAPVSETATQATQIPVVITDVSPKDMPVPMGLELPGGWVFALKASTPGSQWVPTTSEWLSNSEIRRVIGIPWNKQIEAVVQTFALNDTIHLLMTNGDNLVYKVASVTQVDVQDLSVLHDTQPSLAIVLIHATESKRWVVVAYP